MPQHAPQADCRRFNRLIKQIEAAGNSASNEEKLL